MTPRPKKPRNYVCTLCSQFEQVFKPARIPLAQLEIITIFHDEIEALFLCDGQDLDQKTAGEKMGISRATVQRLLAKGRKKMIEALVQKKALAVVPTRNASAAAGQSGNTNGWQAATGGCEQSGPCSGLPTGCDAPCMEEAISPRDDGRKEVSKSGKIGEGGNVFFKVNVGDQHKT